MGLESKPGDRGQQVYPVRRDAQLDDLAGRLDILAPDSKRAETELGEGLHCTPGIIRARTYQYVQIAGIPREPVVRHCEGSTTRYSTRFEFSNATNSRKSLFHWCPVKYFSNPNKSLIISSIAGILPKNDLN